MSQPTAYTPQHSFVADSATVPNFPGQAIDVELNAVKATTDQVRANLARIQRDDGALANGAVTYDSLSPSLQTNGLASASAWTTGTAYAVGSPVVINNNLYRAAIAHTSGVFAIDLAAGNWAFVTAVTSGPVGPAGPVGPQGPQGSITAAGTGSRTVVVGEGALATGDDSTAVGYLAAFNSTGIRNSAFGNGAAQAITTGTFNTAVGYNAGGAGIGQLATVNNSTAIGANAYTTRDGQVALGDDSVDSLRFAGVEMMKSVNPTLLRNYFFGNAGNYTVTGGANIGIGDHAMASMGAAGNANVAVGDFAMPAAGTGNVAIGCQAMYSSGAGAVDITMIGYEAGKLGVSGVGSTGIGRRALAHETTFSNNTGVGDSVLWLCTGAGNVGMGYRVNEYGTTVSESVFIGNGCAANRQTGNYNVYIGSAAGWFPDVTPNSTTGVGAQAAGSNNIGIGYQALPRYTGDDATAIGNGALFLNTTGARNTAIGASGGGIITTGSQNTFLGWGSGGNASQLATAVNSMALGYNTWTTASNQVVLGNSSVTSTILRGAVSAGTGIVGTATNDSASAGSVGEYVEAQFRGATATVTVSIASPAVVTWTSPPYAGAGNWTAPIVFTTTGALPTGITASTLYWAIGTTLSGNTFQIATSVANALAGVAINTSGTQSGTHTGNSLQSLTNNTAADAAAISLTAGDWDVRAVLYGNPTNASTSVTDVTAYLSLTLNTVDTTPGRFSQVFGAAFVPGVNAVVSASIPASRFSLSSTTPIHLVGLSLFTVSTMSMYASISARRVR